MLAIFIAYILDLSLVEPQWMPHPIRGLAWFVKNLENFLRKKIRNLKIAGFLLTVFTLGIVYLIAKCLILGFSTIHPVLGTFVSIALIYFAFSMKDLKSETAKIMEWLEKDDLKNARTQVSHIVGRDTKDLDSDQLIRASVESVAGSAVNKVISVLFYVFIGGPVLLWVYKAVEALDSAVSHKNIYYKDIGWFSAKLEDIFNYIPSRISLFLIPAAAYYCKKGFFRRFYTALKDGRNNPDANSAIPQAAFAGALKVQLGGLNYYEGLPVHKPYLGQPVNHLAVNHIEESVRLAYVCSVILITIMIIVNYIWNIL